MLLTTLLLVLILLALFAGRQIVRDLIVRPLSDRFGPIPWWALFLFIAALIVWRYSQVDSSTTGLIHLARLIVFVTCILWLIWPRRRI